MIITINSWHSPSSIPVLVNYILKEDKSGNGVPEIISNNVRSKTKKGIIKEMIANEQFRKTTRKNSVYAYHVIGSIAVNDSHKVTKEMLSDLANKYISLHGTNAMYAGAYHFDTSHVHFHFCVSGLQYRNGKSFRLSHKEFHDLKVNFQQYQQSKYPELSNSLPQHGKGKEHVSDRGWHIKHKNDRLTATVEVQKVVQESFNQAKTKKFLTRLLENNVHHYERAGVPTGVVVHGDIKIRFSKLGITKEDLSTKKSDTIDEKLISEIKQLRSKNVTRKRDLNFDR